MKGIIGAIIGSSIGFSYEIKKTKDYNFNLIYDKANPTDDSIAIIATVDWLMNTNKTKDEYIDKLHYWCNKFNYGMYNYGLATKFKEWVRNKEREPYNSFGNGSAMRVIPVGWYANTFEECMELAKITAEVTHNHPEGIMGAQCVAGIIWEIKNGNSKKDIKKWVTGEFGYDLSDSYDQLKATHKFECTCANSVPAAIICWLSSTDYIDCVRRAVSLGGDADTEAAIAGAFAAAEMDVDDELVRDVTRFFSMDFLDMLNKFHERIENENSHNKN